MTCKSTSSFPWQPMTGTFSMPPVPLANRVKSTAKISNCLVAVKELIWCHEASSRLWPKYTVHISDSSQQHQPSFQANRIYFLQALLFSLLPDDLDRRGWISALCSLRNQEVSAAMHLAHLSEQHGTGRQQQVTTQRAFWCTHTIHLFQS